MNKKSETVHKFRSKGEGALFLSINDFELDSSANFYFYPKDLPDRYPTTKVGGPEPVGYLGFDGSLVLINLDDHVVSSYHDKIKQELAELD